MSTWIIIVSVCGIVIAFIGTYSNRKIYKNFEETSDGIKKTLRLTIKNLTIKKTKIMNEYGKELMLFYMKGFNDELYGNTTVESEDKLLMQAYHIGAQDALIGDDISSYDLKLPNFTSIWKIATTTKENGEISDTQLLKIFRVLSKMRNDGIISLNN